MDARAPSLPPLILALDIATTTGVCEGRAGDVPKFYTVKFAKEGDEHEDAFERALRWIADRLAVNRPDVIVVEAPINPAAFLGKYDEETGRMGMTSNPETTIRLMGLWATIAAAAKVKGITYRRARVQTVRKSFLGHGNLKGAEAKRRAMEMCKLLGWSPNNRDESDAGCVWFWTCQHFAPRLAPIITPMMQASVANTIAGVEVDDAEAFFKKPNAEQRAQFWKRRARV